MKQMTTERMKNMLTEYPEAKELFRNLHNITVGITQATIDANRIIMKVLETPGIKHLVKGQELLNEIGKNQPGVIEALNAALKSSEFLNQFLLNPKHN